MLLLSIALFEIKFDLRFQGPFFWTAVLQDYKRFRDSFDRMTRHCPLFSWARMRGCCLDISALCKTISTCTKYAALSVKSKFFLFSWLRFLVQICLVLFYLFLSEVYSCFAMLPDKLCCVFFLMSQYGYLFTRLSYHSENVSSISLLYLQSYERIFLVS